MNKETLKVYLSGRYQGWDSFLRNVIFPIFGEEDFESSFEAELLDSQPERRQLADSTGIQSIKQIGMMYVGVEPLQIFDITVNNRVMMERNRVNIQRLIRTVMDQFSCAFMLFHYEDDTRWDWRFTYCRKSGNKEESTDSKRYTFLLGPGQSCRTATENFMALYEKRDLLEIKDIENAFNVEALSDEFFGKYKAFYEQFVNYMVDPDNEMRQYFIDINFDQSGMTPKMIRNREEKPIRDYIKKLLGRIVFLHFLQKKGWLGVPANGEWGNGDHDFMLKLFENASEAQKANFLDEILEPLFSEALDNDRSQRNDCFDTKVEGFRNVRIPYLNGGLFERDDMDEIPSQFPSAFFHDLLTMLSQYNFTIDENDPNDAEVGVDPEMLGRIFENLLEDNKDLGVYYTPKEIVNYMCRESLIAYLQTDQEDLDKECIRQFVYTHDSEHLGDHAAIINKKLKEVKICDPAIGSGAFPMGMLREIFYCRSAIEPSIMDNAADIKRHIIQNNIYGVDIERGAVEIARLRFWLSLIVDEKTPVTLPNLDFKIMQGNSLLESFHGIDLSHLTDLSTEIPVFEPQRNLFGEVENPEMKISFIPNDDLIEFKKRLAKYFKTSDHKERLSLRKEIATFIKNQISIVMDLKIMQCQRIIQDLGDNYSNLKKKQIVALEKTRTNLQIYKDAISQLESIQEQNSEYFLWHTWFNDVFSRPSKEGFDIVIGNPPYIKEYTNREAFNGFREISPYYMGKMDLWYGFACHGLDMANKDSGILCFIAQNNWTTSAGAKLFRQKLVSECRIVQMLDFNDYMVFGNNASIQTMVMLFANDKGSDNYSIDYRHLKAGATRHDMLDMLRVKSSDMIEYLTPVFNRESFNNRFITFSKADSILKKISQGKLHLDDSEIAQGIVFPQDFLNKKGQMKLGHHCVGDGIFGLTNEELYNLHLSAKEQELIKPYYTSDQINRYFVRKDSNSLWMIYTDSSFKDIRKMENYPSIKKHLDQFEPVLTSDNKPYGLHRARNEEFFKGEKILSLRKCVDRPSFTYSNFSCYVTQTYFVIQTNRWNQKFLTGLLNSRLIAFWLKNKGKMQGSNYQVDKDPLINIPLPKPDVDQDQIIRIVDIIISKLSKSLDSDILREESKINELVYQIYGLTDEEIRIIEQS